MSQPRVVILSPHTDDAIFSIGAYLSTMQKPFTIISPMAGVPTDEEGYNKHAILRKEHDQACMQLGANYINGPFLDDVYPPPDEESFIEYLRNIEYDILFLPLGIHHPDHYRASNDMIKIIDTTKALYFYEELPYRVLYPELTKNRLDHLNRIIGDLTLLSEVLPTDEKRKLVRVYMSQTKSEQLLHILDTTPERIWQSY